jgi:predicted nuclease with TOPRIM domain
MSIGIKDIIKPIGSQSFLVGLGVAALAYFLGPQLKESLRPAAVKGAQGVLTLGSKTKELFEEGMGKLTNNVFEKTDEIADKTKDTVESNGFNPDFLKVLKEERESSNKLLEELRNSVISLKEEISQMKNSGNFQHE